MPWPWTASESASADLLAEFVRFEVSFAVLGGCAVGHHAKPPVRVDILRSADGIETESALQRAVPVDLSCLELKVLALEDLIANKRAAARPQDLADVALLERVSKQR